MADNVAITAGAGTTIAADDIGGVLHQRVKLALGADGTGVDAVAGAGAVGTGVQRVTLASDDPAVTALTSSNSQLPSTPSGACTVTITRPANTTAYSAGDVLGGALTIATGMTSAQRIMICSVDLMPNITAIPAGMTSFTLHLYSATPPSAIADNGAFDLPSGDRSVYLGSISVGTPADLGSTLYCQTDGVNRPVQMVGSASIFGYLVTVGGFTPAANSEVYQLRLHFLGL